MSVELLTALSVAALVFVLGALFRRIPYFRSDSNREKQESSDPVTDFRFLALYIACSALYFVFVVIFTVGLSLMFQPFSDRIYSQFSQSIHVFRSDLSTLALISCAIFTSVCLATLPVWLLVYILLGKNVTEQFDRWSLSQEQLDPKRVGRFIIVVITAFVLLVGPLATDVYARFTTSELAVNGWWTFRESVYPYSKIVEIRSMARATRDDQREVAIKDYELEFSTGYVWDSRPWGDKNSQDDLEAAMTLISRQTGLPILIVDSLGESEE